MNNTRESEMLGQVSSAAKDFYSAGAAFTNLGCSTVVAIVWDALADLYQPLGNKVCGLLISFLIVLGYALVLPEPVGYPNAGKFRITLAELIFGFINSFLVFSAAITIKNLG